MRNLYDAVKESLHFNQFIINELVCVEYTCPLKDEHLGVFAHTDYLIHVLSGKKTWKTIHGVWTMEAGQTLFVKKGAAIVTQSFEDDFCMLGFFMPDGLIKEALNELSIPPQTSSKINIQDFSAARLKNMEYLNLFFDSMLQYFRSSKQPPDTIIKLKIKELLLNLLHHCEDPWMREYLHSLTRSNSPSLTHIMENNFCFNLSMEDFAKLSHRSLSKFKRDFFSHYNTTPGKWLVEKRLDYAFTMLNDLNKSITEIAFDSGFENSSHFSRAFKEKFGSSPQALRKTLQPTS